MKEEGAKEMVRRIHPKFTGQKGATVSRALAPPTRKQRYQPPERESVGLLSREAVDVRTLHKQAV
jgi:hypothetical protein